MKEAGKTNYEISIHEGVGHLIDLPFCPPTTISNHPLFPKPIVLQVGWDDIPSQTWRSAGKNIERSAKILS